MSDGGEVVKMDGDDADFEEVDPDSKENANTHIIENEDAEQNGEESNQAGQIQT